MRHLELAPVIHVEIYKKYNIDPSSKEVDQKYVTELCERHKNVISMYGELSFINAVVNDYANIFTAD